MTPSEIKHILAEMGGTANKKLGQHFLIDTATLDAVMEAGRVGAGDRVLEVGPGLGVLTKRLLDAGADVIAIEQDRRFIEYLNSTCHSRESASDGGNSSFQVIHGDAATTHWHLLIGDRSWKLVSNLPYSITSLALRKALWAPRPADRVAVLIQKEVAERLIDVAPKGKTSLLSLMVALSSSAARIVRRVPPGAFFPPPKVSSAVVEIISMPWQEREKKWGIHPDAIMEFARRGFAHPRKMLASNLGWQDEGRAYLETLGYSAKVRAEDVTPADWANLARFEARLS